MSTAVKLLDAATSLIVVAIVAATLSGLLSAARPLLDVLKAMASHGGEEVKPPSSAEIQEAQHERETIQSSIAARSAADAIALVIDSAIKTMPVGTEYNATASFLGKPVADVWVRKISDSEATVTIRIIEEVPAGEELYHCMEIYTQLLSRLRSMGYEPDLKLEIDSGVIRGVVRRA